MPLHPVAAAIVEQLKQQPPLHTLGVDAARAHLIEFAKQMPPGPSVAQIQDRTVPGPRGDIPVRIYTPAGKGPFGVLMYFHGGGWMLGNLDTDDALCRAITNAAQCSVVSVNYRHAPEHKFPAAPEDGYAATVWTAGHAHSFNGDASRLAVCGTSAGGNLAAVVSLMAHSAQYPKLSAQVLLVPVVNNVFTTRSYVECGNGYGLEVATSEWFWDNYLKNPAEGANPYASPLRAADLRDLPPALVMTAEYDLLRSEGEAYAQRLADAAVPVVYRNYAGAIHLYLGDESLHDITRFLRTLLST